MNINGNTLTNKLTKDTNEDMDAESTTTRNEQPTVVKAYTHTSESESDDTEEMVEEIGNNIPTVHARD